MKKLKQLEVLSNDLFTMPDHQLNLFFGGAEKTTTKYTITVNGKTFTCTASDVKDGKTITTTVNPTDQCG